MKHELPEEGALVAVLIGDRQLTSRIIDNICSVQGQDHKRFHIVKPTPTGPEISRDYYSNEVNVIQLLPPSEAIEWIDSQLKPQEV